MVYFGFLVEVGEFGVCGFYLGGVGVDLCFFLF